MPGITWVEHDGSETPPVAPDLNVIVELRDGNVSNVPHPAKEIFWGRHTTERQRKYDVMRCYVVD